MKRFLAIVFMCLGISSQAQVIILNDNVMTSRMSEIKTTVLDSLTNEPVGFASVYVIPSKDTTITNFTITDAKGEAKLDEVPYGSYVFHVEMMGYKPFVKERYFREQRVDMGTIRLQVDEQFLQAATVTDVGNPIVLKKDTLEFNASSFRVGANAMLKDLLQRMPGMEITDDGKVKFNGQAIDKLTVGGRTFFFNDQSTALNNLPAAVVDKIRVIDRESEETRASGIQDGNREKVLDVALKKEYEQGWFGNVGLNGGTTLAKEGEDNPLRDDRGLLWSGNSLVSAYTEKDQVTLITNGQNINDSNAVVVIIDESGDQRTNLNQGLSTAGQVGVNAYTSRIKDAETTVSVNYKYSDTDSGTKADRTTFQEDGDLSSSTQDSGKQYAHSANANMEFQKEKGKVWFHVRPAFSYNKSDSRSNGQSEIARDGTLINRSENTSHGINSNNRVDLDADVTFRELWGKKQRSISISSDVGYGANDGTREELSVLTTAAGTDTRSMRYDSDGNSKHISGSLRFTESFGEKWTLSASAYCVAGSQGNVRNAFDAAGRNDYYSSESRTDYVEQRYDLTAQYKFGQQSYVTLGGRVYGSLNETYSKSYGIEAISGKDEWNWYVVPTLRFIYSKDMDRLSLSASGNSYRQSQSRMLPALSITNPSRLSVGNVYLKPSSQMSFNAEWTRNNRERFSNMMVYLYGSMNTNPLVNATWYDKDGILYSVPVNSRKPRLTGNLVANYTTPLDSKKLWSLTLTGSATINSSVSYQARATLPGMDKDTFDYASFMAEFWGDSDGGRFYGGQSGFAESNTQVFSPTGSISVRFNQDHYSFSMIARTTGRISRYSLDPSTNMKTLDTRLGARGSYTTKHEYEFNTDLSYFFYKGYAEGYGQPEWQWNIEINKSIGAFNLSVTVHDILNQTRNLTHTVTDNYVEDSYRLIMGRYVLFGVKWNFGKMNAAHSSRAQNAAWNMTVF
ncbi:MAG: carboxypeptidase regulatory-like domain-containing protein [Bacteroidales bacterium]|nr:carboxypeptidase regulatory-like domain-containing protein [Bacteroidales bacterium]